MTTTWFPRFTDGSAPMEPMRRPESPRLYAIYHWHEDTIDYGNPSSWFEVES